MQGRNIYNEGGKTLEQRAQSGVGCLIPGNLQGQVEFDSKQPGLVKHIPAYCMVLD